MDTIVERIEREAGVEDLASLLAERLSPTDLQSLLLEVYRRRSARRKPADVLSDYESNRFVCPSSVSPGRLHSWEQTAFSALPSEFEPLALSPVCPLGTNSVIAGVDQNWAVTTARNTEVVSDATNVLALECAVRRRRLLRADARSTEPVHLAASHRVLRAQRFEDPDAVTHFHLIALCSAGRDVGNFDFEVSAFGRQVRFYLESLRALFGPSATLYLSVTDFSGRHAEAWLWDRLLSPAHLGFESVACTVDDSRASGKGYYRDLCFRVDATNRHGERFNLVDGGSVDWTQRLLSNAKERLFVSGIGGERLCSLF